LCLIEAEGNGFSRCVKSCNFHVREGNARMRALEWISLFSLQRACLVPCDCERIQNAFVFVSSDAQLHVPHVAPFSAVIYKGMIFVPVIFPSDFPVWSVLMYAVSRDSVLSWICSLHCHDFRMSLYPAFGLVIILFAAPDYTLQLTNTHTH
jgi:hypothetical protein